MSNDRRIGATLDFDDVSTQEDVMRRSYKKELFCDLNRPTRGRISCVRLFGEVFSYLAQIMEANRVEAKDGNKSMQLGATPKATSRGAFGKDRPKKEKFDLDPEEFSLRKRLPARWPCRKTDVYITRKTNFVAQLERCKKLIDAGNEKIYLHGLGAAVSRAVHLALQLQQFYVNLELDVTTDTVHLTDDILAETDSQESRYNTRSNSAVHICVNRPNPALKS